jgi:hypothetical protein
MDWIVSSCAVATAQKKAASKKERKSLFTGGLQGG